MAKAYTSSQRRWSDDELLEAIQNWAKKHGRPPSFRDWVNAGEGHPSAFTVRSRCGSWNDGLILAGFDINRPGHHEENTVHIDMQKAKKLRQQGKHNTEIAEALGVSASTIRRRLGPRKPKPPKPRNAEERRVARETALKKAIAKGG